MTALGQSTIASRSKRRAQLIDLGTALATAVVLFVGVPTVLVSAVGVPPLDVSKSSPLALHAILDILTLLVWVSWVACCLPLVCSVVRRVRARDLSSAARPLLLDRLGIRIASAILVVGSAAVTVGDTASAAITKAALLARPGPPTARTHRSGPTSIESDPRSRTTLPRSIQRYIERRHLVAEGESLSSIAEGTYGDSSEWDLIARRNLGSLMAAGARFVDPSEIKPGWTLFLPLASDQETDKGKPSIHFGSSSTENEWPTVLSDVKRGQPTRKAKDAEAGDTDSRPTDSLLVQEFCSIGLGALGAAAVARQLRRRRSNGSLRSISEATDDSTVDAAVLVERFQDTPLLSWIETANIRLASEIAKTRDSGEIPTCQLVRASQTGIEFLLTGSTSWSPHGFALNDTGSSWNFPMAGDLGAVEAAASERVPWIPALLPVGTNADGTWLVSIPPGGCVSVLGPKAGSLVATMKLMADGWEWSNSLTVTSDPAVAVSISQSFRAVLFVGDPNAIDARARALCSVLTTSSDVPAGVIVVVDERSATLHPFGITLRPNGLDHRLAHSLTKLAHGATSLPEVLVMNEQSNDVSDAPPSAAAHGLAPVAVRLLTAIPRIDGLQEALPPKRARRATEVVAYLALHRPDPVTSDRLRTRVLGTRESDAAAKTLFNTVGAARRALGVGGDGTQLLPTASKSGHYRLSACVGMDVIQSMSLCEAARNAAADEESMALYRAALSLVEGEPLSGTLSGYSWWRAEGYEARVSVVLVEAACQLSELAIRAQLFDLARWGLERGRMIDPYSELLSRSAMELAASSGDFARLRREWIECQRRVDELDPGCLPSESTTRLFAELSDRLLVIPN